MPPTNNPFPHLTIIRRFRGLARGRQLKKPEHDKTAAAKADRRSHSGGLNTSAARVASSWKLKVDEREEADLPVLPKNVPLLLEVDTDLDLDELRQRFGFELVSEQESGFVIVASEDVDLSVFRAKLREFVNEVRGSASVAKVHRLDEDADHSKRLETILDPDFLPKWPTLEEEEDYLVDVGIACAGEIQLSRRPNEPKRGKQSDRAFANRQAKYADKLKAWNEERTAAHMAWDDLAVEREEQVKGFVEAYGGEMMNRFDRLIADQSLAGEFTLRIQLPGKGLRDLVLNYPFLFEVAEPEDVELPQSAREAIARHMSKVTLVPPAADAPAVCVIDSGIQEKHPLLVKAVDEASSHCFLPGVSPTDVADYVKSGGHGTRIAGAILYGESIPRVGRYELPFWVQNARVLNERSKMPVKLFPPDMLSELIRRYHQGPRGTRIFNHSVTASTPCRGLHMSAWAATIDQLSHLYDVLFVVSSGNINQTGSPTNPGVQDHLAAGREYPAYLCEDASRIASPAQSLQALTVGSVGYGEFDHPDWRACAHDVGYPSAFSRSGHGIWKSIKPEVVEFGGDNLVSKNATPDVGTPDCGRECYPELVRSTMFPPGPAFDRDDVGTSYAAPKVSRIAARLQKVLPDESCLLYRALIVQSARWPAWAKDASRAVKGNIVRWIGYGLPDVERATTNTQHRTTLVTNGTRSLKAGDCHIFQVPIPKELRRQSDEYEVLIEVTLSYSAEPRRTRRNRRNYLSTWLDWKSSNRDEPLAVFYNRAIKTEQEEPSEGTPFDWELNINPQYGTVAGVSRSAGTVQKDWTLVKSNELPEDFCIAVVGHRGWSKDPDSAATYTLAVSIEVVGKEIPIYERLRVSVEKLKAEVETEVEVEVLA